VVSKTKDDLKDMTEKQDNVELPGTVYGFTDASAGPRPDRTIGRPPEFVDYTAKDLNPAKDPYTFLQTQVFELGNSLGAITHKSVPSGPIQPGSSPENKEWGKQLLDCFQGNL
jgi:hypothetical protein